MLVPLRLSVGDMKEDVTRRTWEKAREIEKERSKGKKEEFFFFFIKQRLKWLGSENYHSVICEKNLIVLVFDSWRIPNQHLDESWSFIPNINTMDLLLFFKLEKK